MVNLSIVQGRLSSSVGGRYQYFPIHAWRKEFATASQIGFNGIEWIVSDFSNPIFDEAILNEVIDLAAKHEVKVTSIGLDVLMYNPVFKLPWADVSWLFDRLSKAVKSLKVQRVSIPIEENSGIRSREDTALAVDTLRKISERYCDDIPLISLETDLSPQNAKKILSEKGLEQLGLLVDTGNIAANGFKIEDFVALCGSRIYGLHIKDRRAGFGPTCPLGEGDAQIQKALQLCGELPKLADITLQAYRTPNEYVENAKAALEYVKKYLWRNQSILHH